MTRRRAGVMRASALPPEPRTGLGSIESRHRRTPRSLSTFAFLVALCFILVPIVDPTAAITLAKAESETVAPGLDDIEQTLTAGEAALWAVDREEFGVTRVRASAPAAGMPDPGTAQAIAYAMLQERGWGDDQYSCLVSLWDKESHWNVYAHNTRSGAYGIPQALPGDKMATIAADWQTNPETQIIWGLSYIEGRYTDPCGAWTSSQTRGWY